MTLKAEIAAELVKAFRSFGAKSDLLGIVGSMGDTMSDKWVHDALKHWNAAQKKTAVPIKERRPKHDAPEG